MNRAALSVETDRSGGLSPLAARASAPKPPIDQPRRLSLLVSSPLAARSGRNSLMTIALLSVPSARPCQYDVPPSTVAMAKGALPR